MSKNNTIQTKVSPIGIPMLLNHLYGVLKDIRKVKPKFARDVLNENKLGILYIYIAFVQYLKLM